MQGDSHSAAPRWSSGAYRRTKLLALQHAHRTPESALVLTEQSCLHKPVLDQPVPWLIRSNSVCAKVAGLSRQDCTLISVVF